MMRHQLGILIIATFLLAPAVLFGASAPVWKTGQQTSYYSTGTTGDDGFFQRGVAWPSPRFSDIGDGSVKDRLTGLVWLKDAGCLGNDTWQTGLDAVGTLNSDYTTFTCEEYTGAYTDWRLPNMKELRSLIDYSQFNPALPADHLFVNVATQFYWSSTTYFPTPASAQVVNLGHGDLIRTGKTNKRNIWAVRAGLLPPKINFMAASTSGSTPFPAQFTITNDSSTEVVTWIWGFGDGQTSYEMEPAHNYAQAGTYTVTLTARGIGGEVITTKTDYITVIANISGQVTTNIGGHTNLPVGNASLTLIETGAATTTDSQGNFLFDDIASGTYTMQITSPDFITTTRTIVITQGQGVNVAVSGLIAGEFTQDDINEILACNYDFPLTAGWNLVSLAVKGGFTASTLLETINTNGGNITRIMGWDGSGWITYHEDAPFGDFSIDDQQGYFIFAEESAVIDFCLD